MYSRQKILVVDRPSSQLEQLISILRDSGYDVSHFQDTQKAYDFCLTNRPNIILLEWHMPVVSGVKLYEKLKSRFTTRNLPIIVLTRELELEDRLKSLSMEIDDYVPKPYYPEEVAARVDMILHEIELIEESRKSLEHGFMGHLSEMNLVDLIQTLELGKKSGIIHLNRGGSEGQVYVNEGILVDANLEGFEPSRALTHMLTWLDGTFWVSLQPVDRTRMINEDNHDILIKGTKLIHQWRQLVGQLPSLDTELMAIRTEDSNVTKTEHALLQLFAEPRTILQGLEASKLDDLEALEHIKSLLNKGFLVKTNASSSGRSRTLGRRFGGNGKGNNGYARIASFFKRRRNNEPDGKPSAWNDRAAGKAYEGKTRNLRTPHRILLSKAELMLIRQKLASDEGQSTET